MDVYVMTFHALKEADERRVKENPKDGKVSKNDHQ